MNGRQALVVDLPVTFIVYDVGLAGFLTKNRDKPFLGGDFKLEQDDHIVRTHAFAPFQSYHFSEDIFRNSRIAKTKLIIGVAINDTTRYFI